MNKFNNNLNKFQQMYNKINKLNYNSLLFKYKIKKKI